MEGVGDFWVPGQWWELTAPNQGIVAPILAHVQIWLTGRMTPTISVEAPWESTSFRGSSTTATIASESWAGMLNCMSFKRTAGVFRMHDDTIRLIQGPHAVFKYVSYVSCQGHSCVKTDAEKSMKHLPIITGLDYQRWHHATLSHAFHHNNTQAHDCAWGLNEIDYFSTMLSIRL